jgi:hypothetical protein
VKHHHQFNLLSFTDDVLNIFIIIVVSLNEQMIDEFINENTIRSNKIQFIFKQNIRFEIDSIVVLSEMKNSEKLFIDVNSMMIMLMSKLKIYCMKDSTNQKTMNLI